MAPGRPSGVSSGDTNVSTDDSAGDMIIDDANPDAVLAAIKAHFSLAAVISILPAHMGNISAKVSSIVTMFPFSVLTMKSPLSSFLITSRLLSFPEDFNFVSFCDILETCH